MFCLHRTFIFCLWLWVTFSFRHLSFVLRIFFWQRLIRYVEFTLAVCTVWYYIVWLTFGACIQNLKPFSLDQGCICLSIHPFIHSFLFQHMRSNIRNLSETLCAFLGCRFQGELWLVINTVFSCAHFCQWPVFSNSRELIIFKSRTALYML